MDNYTLCNTRERLIMALIEFVERAAKKDATQAEITALPEVANVLKTLLDWDWD